MPSILAPLVNSLRPGLEIEAADITDAELLGRFARTRDPLSFELLFWRHGAMVHGVCKRLLTDPADVEDAFQAVFIILARKANTLSQGSILAGWLHRIAWRIALDARRARKRRNGYEAITARPETISRDPAAEAIERETLQMIDAAVARLPKQFREPFVLCELEGRSRKAAARELGIPLGTLDSRLSRAKERLRGKLQGSFMPALMVVALPKSVSVAPLLGQSVSPSVMQLVAGCGALAIKKTLIAASAFLLLTAGATFGTMMIQHQSKEKPAAKIAETPKEKPPEKNAIDPKGDPLPVGALARIGNRGFIHGTEIAAIAYSADGKMLASASIEAQDSSICVWDAETGKEIVRIPLPDSRKANIHQSSWPIGLKFSVDGKRLTLLEFNAIRILDIATKKEAAKFDLPKAADQWLHLAEAAISPDAKKAVMVMWDGSVEVYSLTDGKLLNKITVPEKKDQFHVVFSHDSERFLIDSNHRLPVEIFDLQSLKIVKEIPASPNRSIGAIRFLGDGRNVVLLSLGKPTPELHIVEIESGKTLRTCKVNFTAYWLEATPDGKKIIVANNQSDFAEIFDAATLKELGKLPNTPTQRQLLSSPNGKRLAGIHAYRGSISVWDLDEKQYLPATADPHGFYDARFSADGKAIVLDGHLGRPVIDWLTGKIIRSSTESLGSEWDRRIKLSPDGRTKVVESFDKESKTRSLHVIEVASGKILHKLEGHTDYVAHLVFSDDGKKLASVGQDKVIFVWDLATGKQLAHFTSDVMTGHEQLLFTRDDTRLITCDNQSRVPGSPIGNVIFIWDVEAGHQLFQLNAPSLFFASVAVSPDGRFIAGGGGERRGSQQKVSEVTIWDTNTGKVLHSLPNHDCNALRPGAWCDFSPDSRLLATGDCGGHLRLWETATGKEVFSFEGHKSEVIPHFSPDGKLLVAASEDAPCYIWEVIPEKGANLDPESAWRDLIDEDAKKAFQAIRALAANPVPAVELLKQNLKRLLTVENKQIDQWIKSLDADKFAEREKATKELTKIAEWIPNRLIEAKKSAGTEGQDRLKKILQTLGKPSPERLRQIRAVQALNYIGTPEAKAIIDKLK